MTTTKAPFWWLPVSLAGVAWGLARMWWRRGRP